MKSTFKILSSLVVLASMLSACSKTDLSKGRDDQINGLMNVTLKIPGDAGEYSAVKKGPYEEGEEIIVKLPTSDEQPLDVTRIFCSVSVEHNCYVKPAVGKLIDFTEPYPITVIDVLGNEHHNTIRVIPVPPKTRYQFLWKKTTGQLGCAGFKITGMAMTPDYIALQEWGDAKEQFRLNFLDFKTGEKVSSVPSAKGLTYSCATDDAGHLLVASENIYGAGFDVFLYVPETKGYRPVCSFTAAAGCPKDLGLSFSVTGDITEGKAYLYAAVPKSMDILFWEFNNGELVTPAAQPQKMFYGPAKENWDYARVKRASLAPDSEIYISWFKKGGHDKEAGSHFNICDPDMVVTALNQLNHLYKILDFKVLELDGDTFLLLNCQDFLDWSGSRVYVYEITDRGLMELTPGEPGYENFLLFRSDEIQPVNYNKIGDLAYHVVPNEKGYEVYIAASAVGISHEQSVVRMYKMTYLHQD